MEITETFETTDQIIENNNINCPLDIGVIPNYIGINLCSVKGVSWKRQEDGQLVDLIIHFKPAKNICEDCNKDYKKGEYMNIFCGWMGDGQYETRCNECWSKYRKTCKVCNMGVNDGDYCMRYVGKDGIGEFGKGRYERVCFNCTLDNKTLESYFSEYDSWCSNLHEGGFYVKWLDKKEFMECVKTNDDWIKLQKKVGLIENGK